MFGPLSNQAFRGRVQILECQDLGTMLSVRI